MTTWPNTFWAMVIPFLVSPWNMLIMRNSFMALPESLEEAAIIDGASPLQTLVRIVLPLSTASIATIGLFYAVWHWNEWFYAFLYINDTVKLPLQVVLRNILTAGMIEDTEMIPIDQLPPAQSLKTAMIVVTPILCVYPFIQRSSSIRSSPASIWRRAWSAVRSHGKRPLSSRFIHRQNPSDPSTPPATPAAAR